MAADENAEKTEPTGSTGAGGNAAGDAGLDDGADEVKARFKEALERKRGQHADGVGGGGPRSSKVQDVHSRAGAKRMFRRKSGG